MIEDDFDKIEKPPSNLKSIILIVGFIIISIILIGYDNIKNSILNTNDDYKYNDYDYYDYSNYDDYNYNYYDNYDSDEEDYEEDYKDYYNYHDDQRMLLKCFDLSVSKINDYTIGLVLENQSQSDYSDLELNLIFIDGKKRVISVEKINIDCILANGKWATDFSGFPEQFEDYDFSVAVGNYNLEEKAMQFRSLEINQTFDSNTNLHVKLKNNYSKKMKIAEVVAIYYDKNGNVLETENFFADNLMPKESVDLESHIYLDIKEKEDISVEIVVETVFIE